MELDGIEPTVSCEIPWFYPDLGGMEYRFHATEPIHACMSFTDER